LPIRAHGALPQDRQIAMSVTLVSADFTNPLWSKDAPAPEGWAVILAQVGSAAIEPDTSDADH